MPTVGQIVRHRAQTQPDQPAFTVVAADQPTETVLTYADLDRSARAVAVALAAHGGAGQRVLLALPQSVGYLTGLFGSMLAGATAIPCYPPQSRRRSRLLATLAVDAQATIVLTDAGSRERVQDDLASDPQLRGLHTLTVEEIGDELAADYQADPRGGPTALLQYTSGSTAAPKGVMVSHENLVANAFAVQDAFGWSPETTMVMWCPLFHDMGLFAGALGPMIIGFHSVLLRPEDFIMRPLRWLQAVTRHQGTMGGGPDFGFELCASRATPAECEGLDLRSWRCVFNGAEPVRAGTLERFTATFAEYGFAPEAFHPCYGMAEATSFISGGRRAAAPVVGVYDATALSQGQAVPTSPDDPRARKLVSCGRVSAGHQAYAVDLATRAPLPERQVGEVWFTGPSVAGGYWRSPVASDETYAGRLDSGAGPFLRTGDLGFIHDGEIYLVGRIKDIVIIRGRNYSPSDLELTIRHSHPELRRTEGVAFSVESDGEERLVVMWEVRVRRAGFDPTPIVEAVRAALTTEHGIDLHALVLLRPGGVPRTTSGKVQRSAGRARYIAQNLEPIAGWTAPVAGERAAPAGPVTATDRAGIAQEVETWLVEQLSRSLGLAVQEVAVDRPLAEYGLDSLQGTRIAADLSVLLGRQLPATLVWDHPTIAKLASYLAESPEAAR